MPSSTKWRLNISANGGYAYTYIAEMEMRASIGGADQCSGGTPTASSTYSSMVPANAFDDSTATYWASANTITDPMPQWIEYEFAAAVNVLEYTLYPRSDRLTGAPRDWTLEYWDGADWIVVDTQSGQTWGSAETKTFQVESSGATNLIIAEAAHDHAADAPILTQDHSLIVSECYHLHDADNLEITESAAGLLEIQGADHLHSAGAADLIQLHILTVLECYHAHASPEIVLSQANAVLTVSDGAHLHYAESAYLMFSYETTWGAPPDSAPALYVSLDGRVFGADGALDYPGCSVKASALHYYIYNRHADQARFAIYQGGSPSAPDGAVLVKDCGQSSGSDINTWNSIAISPPVSLDPSKRLWLAAKSDGDSDDFWLRAINGSAGDLYKTVQVAESAGTMSTDQTEPFESEWPDPDGGTAADYVLCAYLTITVEAAKTLQVKSVTHEHAAGAIANFNPILEISGVDHILVSDGIDFGQHFLSPSECAHVLSVDGLQLTQLHHLEVADLAHAHAADNLSLSTRLVVAEAAHDHLADPISLAQEHVLSVDGGFLSSSSPTVAITQRHALAASDSVHLFDSDEIDLDQNVIYNLVAQEAAHVLASDEIALTGVQNLAVEDGGHDHTADALLLTGIHNLSAAGSHHLHAADALALFQLHGLAVADTYHDVRNDALRLIKTGALVTDNCAHAAADDLVRIFQAHELMAADGYHLQAVDAGLALTQDHTLDMDASHIYHLHCADNIVFAALPEIFGVTRLVSMTPAHTFKSKTVRHRFISRTAERLAAA